MQALAEFICPNKSYFQGENTFLICDCNEISKPANYYQFFLFKNDQCNVHVQAQLLYRDLFLITLLIQVLTLWFNLKSTEPIIPLVVMVLIITLLLSCERRNS